MTIPASYIGLDDLLSMGIIKEYYSLETMDNACRWIKEDIIDNYKDDYRVHIVRTNAKTINVIKEACKANNIRFKIDTSIERLSKAEIKELFKDRLTNHVVLAIKGFLRRANLIPNNWKLRIGATHELFTKNPDYNTCVQGLPGRTTGYWRVYIENGHKTGPYRTCIDAIIEYEKTYLDPFGINSYKTSTLKKKQGKITSISSTMLSPHNINGLVPIDLPTTSSVPIVIKLEPHEFTSIKKIKGSWDHTTILELIHKYSPQTHTTIKDMVKGQIVQPETDASYSKLITAFINANRDNKKYTWSLSDDKYKREDVYQIYLDNRSNNIIISIYYGKLFI